jgi:DNA-binding Lrp family transcriptional regulator
MAVELLDLEARQLLERVQRGVPLAPRPWAEVARDLGSTEARVLAHLTRLRDAGVVRHVGGIFDTRACGYASALVAARVPPGALEAAATVLGAHPGVSHCYERDHAWNLWFTLAVSPTSRLGLAGTAARLAARAALEAWRLLPALRVYKISARFAFGAGSLDDAPPPAPARLEPLTSEEVAVVRALQRPLALVPNPFLEPACRVGLDELTLLARARALAARGVLRRFAALLHHRRAGFTANVLVGWALPPQRLDEAGQAAAALAAVSHCYARPVFPDWPYALLTMVHGRWERECLDAVDTLRARIRPDDLVLLWSGREFKKTRLELFTPAEAAWEAEVEP